MWRNGKQSPSLLNVLALFIISDGNVSVIDMLSEKDQFLLTQFLYKLSNDKLSELIVRLQKSFNNYSITTITDYLDDEDLL